jgi:hypothetical protein
MLQTDSRGHIRVSLYSGQRGFSGYNGILSRAVMLLGDCVSDIDITFCRAYCIIDIGVRA